MLCYKVHLFWYVDNILDYNINKSVLFYITFKVLNVLNKIKNWTVTAISKMRKYVLHKYVKD